MLALVFALAASWLAVNLLRWPKALRLAGTTIFLGAALNGLVILVNGRMPYSPTAAALAGIKPGPAAPPRPAPAARRPSAALPRCLGWGR
jgi:hypothetical protein